MTLGFKQVASVALADHPEWLERLGFLNGEVNGGPESAPRLVLPGPFQGEIRSPNMTHWLGFHQFWTART